MKTVEITEEQKQYSKDLAKKIYKDNQSMNDKGGHAKKNPEKINHVGFLGETIYADLHDLDRPELIEGDVDQGYDFKKDGDTIDVKTSDKGKDLIIFPSNKNQLADRLVQIYIDDDTAQITMDVTREEFLENHGWRDFGYGKRLYLAHDYNE